MSVSLGRDMRVYSSELPPFHYKKLVRWSFCDRKTKTTLAKDVLVARTEANSDLIDQKMADTASDYGVSVAELESIIAAADAAGVSNVQLHGLLAEHVGNAEAVMRAIAAK